MTDFLIRRFTEKRPCEERDMVNYNQGQASEETNPADTDTLVLDFHPPEL